MNKLFAALLLFCVIGATVLWWLMKTLPDRKESHVPPAAHSAPESHEEPAPPGQVVLIIDTIPQGAKVELGGVYAGMTPLEVPLREAAVEALVALEGFEVYRREVPTLAQAEGAELNWKITLKAKNEAPSKTKPVKNAWLHGSRGPYFVQLKASEISVGKTAIDTMIAELRAGTGYEKISGCLVNLGAKGKWYRVLAGPFDTRKAADAKRVEWMTKNTEVIEGFVTGRQSCI